MAIQMTEMDVALTDNLNFYIIDLQETQKTQIHELNVKEALLLIVHILDELSSEEKELNIQVKSEKMAIRVMEMVVVQLVK